MAILLLRATIAMLAAFGGGIAGVGLGQLAARRLTLLVYAALGALLAVTLFDVLPDAKALLTWPEFLPAAASGYVLFWAMGRYVYHICPACAAGALEQAPAERLGGSVPLLMIALGLHSAMDGLAIVVGDRVAGHPNLALLLAVSFHKLPEGLALALLLLGAGYSRRNALAWTLAIESTTVIGALAGLVGLRHVALLVPGLLLAHVGGGFAYLIATTLGLFSRPVGTRRSLPAPMPVLAGGGLAFSLTSGLMLLLRRLLP